MPSKTVALRTPDVESCAAAGMIHRAGSRGRTDGRRSDPGCAPNTRKIVSPAHARRSDARALGDVGSHRAQRLAGTLRRLSATVRQAACHFPPTAQRRGEGGGRLVASVEWTAREVDPQGRVDGLPRDLKLCHLMQLGSGRNQQPTPALITRARTPAGENTHDLRHHSRKRRSPTRGGFW